MLCIYTQLQKVYTLEMNAQPLIAREANLINTWHSSRKSISAKVNDATLLQLHYHSPKACHIPRYLATRKIQRKAVHRNGHKPMGLLVCKRASKHLGVGERMEHKPRSSFA